MNKIKSALTYLLALTMGMALAYGVMYGYNELSPKYSVGENKEYFAGRNEQVIVYGTAWCKYCEKTREYFSEKNVLFVELDIEKSGAAKQQYEKLAGGGVPMVLIGNRRISGFLPSEFESALSALEKK
jgi:mycoredoxin